MISPMATGLVWHERYMWHDTGSAAGPLPAGGWIEPDTHVENPATKRRLKNLLDVSGLGEQLVHLEPRPATLEELCRVHTTAYVERIRELSGAGGGDAGGLTPFGPGSYEIAVLAAGGAIVAVDAVLDAEVENVYALVRPPGHHALADEGMGFCLFGNVAIAVQHALHARGVERVAVVDWDVHHGNGTEAAFYDNPSVLTISIHQDSCFPPGSGPVDRTGEGLGEGFNINVPLPPGSGDGAYHAAFERVVLPALHSFRPELVIGASGFDANGMDPLGRMLLHSGSYRWMTRQLLDAAAETAGGRLTLCHEGGYSTAVVPFCGLAVLEELSGIATEVSDPFLQILEPTVGHELTTDQEAQVARAERVLDRALSV
jgi:acetoin utilization deacetylase AcuC-like enzyme